MQNKLEQLLKLINFTFDIGFGEMNPHWSFLKKCNIHNTSLSINNDMLYIKEFNNVREVSLIHLFVEYNHIINSKYMNFFYCLLLLQWKFEANDLFLRNQNNKEFRTNYKTIQFGNELPLEYSTIITIADEYKSFYRMIKNPSNMGGFYIRPSCEWLNYLLSKFEHLCSLNKDYFKNLSYDFQPFKSKD